MIFLAHFASVAVVSYSRLTPPPSWSMNYSSAIRDPSGLQHPVSTTILDAIRSNNYSVNSDNSTVLIWTDIEADEVRRTFLPRPPEKLFFLQKTAISLAWGVLIGVNTFSVVVFCPPPHSCVSLARIDCRRSCLCSFAVSAVVLYALWEAVATKLQCVALVICLLLYFFLVPPPTPICFSSLLSDRPIILFSRPGMLSLTRHRHVLVQY
jgi:hypothetical protein